ncbi:unnamed protein product [Owenia fusiformis]|uniref:Uncharacterized protein n=1 Tax=Owenia fusiformis TaxID=6347 RepID=A0A8J1XIP4_OWEFU|nr:unnamed protein product [Owenia fusiformis]
MHKRSPQSTMAAAQGQPEKRDIIDLDSCIEEFFWTERFRYSRSFCGLRNNRNQFEVELVFKNLTKENSPPTTSVHKDSDLTGDDPQEKNLLLYKTEFRNSTKGNQEYNISSQRNTTSVCETVVNEGHTIGGKIGIKLKPGDIVEAGAGFKEEISIINEERETVQHEMQWGINTKITVPPDKRVIAKLIVSDERLTADFVILSWFKGEVLAKFRNKKNNVMIALCRAPIHRIINWAKSNKDYSVAMKRANVDREGTVTLESSITCKFRYSVQQHVVITEHEIEKSDNSPTE